MEEVSTINQRKVASREAEESFTGLEKSELAELKSKVSLFTRIAWGCVVLGLIVAVSGILIMWGSDFNEIGDFIGGTAGALWGLAGLFFIYIAFLGQKEQLIYQQAELRETRKDIRQQAKQLEGQKEQLILQNEQFERQFRLAIYPRLHIEIREFGGYESDEGSHFEVSINNIGEEAATDIEYYLFGENNITEIEGPPDDPTDVYERTDYTILGVKTLSILSKKDILRVGFAYEGYYAYLALVLQFRDVTGENYLECYSFSGEKQSNIEQRKWHLFSKEPSSIQKYSRMKIVPGKKEMFLPYLKAEFLGAPVPNFLRKEMMEEFGKHTILSLMGLEGKQQ